MASLTKKQLKEELEKLGVLEEQDYPKTATNADLEELLKTAQKANANTDDDGADNDGDDNKEDDEEVLGPQLKKNTLSYSGKGPIDIINGDQYVRTYSEEAHGEDFQKLAKGFVNKNTDPKTKKTPFRMVNSDKVKEVYLEYTEINKRTRKLKSIKKKYKGTVEGKEKALAKASEHNVNVYFN